MGNINLTWDLFVIVFFAVIIAYSFIIGRNKTLKVVIATYIAILAADGVGNLIERFLIGETPLVNAFGISDHLTSVILIKIFIFVLAMVLIVMWGSFEIHIAATNSATMNILLNLAYGALSAGLIISSILTYIAGISLFDSSGVAMNQAMEGIYNQSHMVRIMLNNGSAWFSFPAIVFVVASFIGKED